MEQRIEPRLIKAEPYFHVGLWLVVLFYPYLKYMEQKGGYPMPFLHELNSLFFKMTISYFLYGWFFPQRKKVWHVGILMLAFSTNVLLYEYMDNFFHPRPLGSLKNIVADSLTYIGFGVLFYTLFTVKTLYRKQLEIDTLRHEKDQAELKAIKARINPHFLFNTLNTLYAHALRKDDDTPALIIKLSDTFRYVLEEGGKEVVPIQSELQHIQDYIDLQQQRLADKVVVKLATHIDDGDQEFAPLILESFIENAFKYTSQLKGNQHPIDISIHLNQGEFQFMCINPYNETVQDNPEWKGSGSGNADTRKRIDMLYPGKSNLNISKSNNQYQVTLKMTLI